MAGLTARVRALAWLRWRLMVNGLRRGTAVASAVVAVLLALLALLLAALLAVVTAAFVLLVGRSGDMSPFAVHLGVFCALTVFGFLLPLLFGEAKVELEAERFLSFPVALRELYWIGLLLGFVSGANLVLYPSFLAVAVGGLSVPGANSAGVVLGTLGLLAALVAWQRLLIATVRTLASHRRSREILAVVGLSVMVLLTFLPHLAERQGWFRHHPQIRLEPGFSLPAVITAAEALPPVLAARAVSTPTPARILPPLAGLALWTAAGLWLDWRVFRWRLRASGGATQATNAVRSRRRASIWDGLPRLLPPPAAGTFRKQFRYLLRSTAGRITLVTAPLMGLFVSIVFGRLSRGFAGFSAQDLGFLGICFLAGANIGNFAYNLFMWDRDGAAIYLVAPARLWEVLLGLTAALWLFEAVVFAEMATVWLLLAGPPHPLVFLMGTMISAGMTLGATGPGLVASVLFPVAREIGSPRNPPALVSSLISVLAMPVIVALVGLAPGFFLAIGRPWPAMAVSAGGVLLLAVGYRFALILAVRLLFTRREAFLEALQP